MSVVYTKTKGYYGMNAYTPSEKNLNSPHEVLFCLIKLFKRYECEVAKIGFWEINSSRLKVGNFNFFFILDVCGIDFMLAKEVWFKSILGRCDVHIYLPTTKTSRTFRVF